MLVDVLAENVKLRAEVKVLKAALDDAVAALDAPEVEAHVLPPSAPVVVFEPLRSPKARRLCAVCQEDPPPPGRQCVYCTDGIGINAGAP